MLFYGPPGTGKTSTILALARSLYGPSLFPTRVLELNASDERGISIVREKIKDFARQQLSNAPLSESYRSQYPCPPYKIIVLDEADSMTQDAQSALRRTMEQYSRITRFCLVCNYVTRIIDPLASRCSKFRFKMLDGGSAGLRLQDIAKLESVHYEDGVIEKLIECSEGDLRRAITYLQSAARLIGAGKPPPVTKSNAGKKSGKKGRVVEDEDSDDDMPDAPDSLNGTSGGATVTIRTIEEIAGVIPTPVISSLRSAMQPPSKSAPAPNSETPGAIAGKVYTAVAKHITDLVADGWSATQLLTQLYHAIVFDDNVPDRQKARIVGVFSEVDKRLVDGSDEHLTVLDMCLRVAGILGS